MSAPHYSDARVTLHAGDCLDVLRELPDASVDSVVTDPPYGLGFMGKEWDSGKSFVERKPARRNNFDHVGGNHNPTSSADAARTRRVEGQRFGAWCEEWAAECLRVLKPGGHLLAFGGTRTWHRLACAVEDAGFEVRDSIAWLYGSGFPKSLDVSKAIDKAAGAEREVVGFDPSRFRDDTAHSYEAYDAGTRSGRVDYEKKATITAPATDAAREWAGWGTALKPAFEPVVVARKPLTGTVAGNVLAHGTGALNIDATRIGATDALVRPAIRRDDNDVLGKGLGVGTQTEPAGRWPANVVLDEAMADVLDEQSGTSLSQGGSRGSSRGATQGASNGGTQGGYNLRGNDGEALGYGDTGGASRFFLNVPNEESGHVYYCICGRETDDACPEHGGPPFMYVAKAPKRERPVVDGVAHPTVKPLALMRWLVRLVTPPGGTVLEPFAGSGTTVEACVLEGVKCIAIEKGDEYLPLILERIRRQDAARIADEVTRRPDPTTAIAEQVAPLGLFDLDPIEGTA